MGVAKELRSLIINGKFLDEHTMGELEDKIWDWLQRAFGVCQGTMEEEGFYIQILLMKRGEENELEGG